MPGEVAIFHRHCLAARRYHHSASGLSYADGPPSHEGKAGPGNSSALKVLTLLKIH